MEIEIMTGANKIVQVNPPIIVTTLKEAETAFFEGAAIILCLCSERNQIADLPTSRKWVTNYEDAKLFYEGVLGKSWDDLIKESLADIKKAKPRIDYSEITRLFG